MNNIDEKLVIVNQSVENDNIEETVKNNAVENAVLESDMDELKELDEINKLYDEDIDDAIAIGEWYAKFKKERKTA